MSEYFATIGWKRNPDEDFLQSRYSRGHSWTFDGGVEVPASSSPHVVPLPYSVAANVDPRESDLARVSQDVLDRWKASTDGQPASSGASFEAEAAQTVEIWHWILLTLAIIVIGESILGNMHLTPRRMENA